MREKLEKPGDHENDFIQLSRISENNQASHLLKLLITTSLVCDLEGLFTLVLNELKGIVDFTAAELVLFGQTGEMKYNRLSYMHGRVNTDKDEDHPAQPFNFNAPLQLHRSHWFNILPTTSSLFNKETEFEYSYYIPFIQQEKGLATLVFRTNQKGGFSQRHFAVLHISGKILTPKFLDLINKAGVLPLTDEREPANDHSTEEHYSPGKGERVSRYGGLITGSENMRQVFSLVAEIAQTPSSVLILGETGTGKELVARALHNGSDRSNKLMIKVNCAALPADIIESELFGHERGSFTGATERKIGKFEAAHNSTLFLDEVGELPPELQVKLLRVLQEREIERIGGKGVIKINVRIVTATNRDLLKEVKAGNFRSDLYFRLNVFPVTLPPLRERKEDIPFLALHFLEKYRKNGTKRVTGFSSRVMKQLKAFDWPGNVRELENLVQRCMLLTKGGIIKELPTPLNGTETISKENLDIRIKTIEEVEREHIIAILKKCNGKVAGIGGAAEALRIPSSTLNSKMRRLRIKFAYMDRA